MMLSRIRCYDCGKRERPQGGLVIGRTDENGKAIRAWVCHACLVAETLNEDKEEHNNGTSSKSLRSKEG